MQQVMGQYLYTIHAQITLYLHMDSFFLFYLNSLFQFASISQNSPCPRVSSSSIYYHHRLLFTVLHFSLSKWESPWSVVSQFPDDREGQDSVLGTKHQHASFSEPKLILEAWSSQSLLLISFKVLGANNFESGKHHHFAWMRNRILDNPGSCS